MPKEANHQVPLSLLACLDNVQDNLNKNQKIASIWRDWPKVAGEELTKHCTPLSFYQGILTIGASHPQWIQALVFNKHQLLEAFQAKGHDVKELKIKNHFSKSLPNRQSENETWDKHPSRVDIHGFSNCNQCNKPAPIGELNLWGKCGLCRRKDLSIQK